MTSKRKTGNDYLKEYNLQRNKLISLESNILNRLVELSDIYPNAPISGNVVAEMLFKDYDVKDYNIIDVVRYIIAIEKYAEEQSGHIQTQIDFN